MSSYNENRRLLVVDDDPLIIKVYQKLFSGEMSEGGNLERIPASQELTDEVLPEKAVVRENFQLDCFLQGLDAVAAVEQARRESKGYAVAVIDMRMPPGIDGLETAQRIHAIDPNIHLIFVTAYSDHSTDEISKMVSRKALWFRKPFESEVLYQAVRSSCESWNQSTELHQLKESLSWQVERQTERLQEKVKAMELLQKNCLERERVMGELKHEVEFLQAYQDLRLLLSKKPLPAVAPQLPESELVELLLVHDSATVRAMYQMKLEQLGYRVITAGSVDAAFELALKSPPDLALIDYLMPEGNGDKLISLMRTDFRTKHVLPVLFTNADEAKSVALGAVCWIPKDFTDEVLLQQMGLILNYIYSKKMQQSQIDNKVLAIFSKHGQVANRRVLVVDDEQHNLDLLSDILEGSDHHPIEQELSELVGHETKPQHSAEFEVTQAQQGLEAVAVAQQAEQEQQPFAVAIIDMRMPPGIDGLETAQRIRHISPQIEVVIMTAYSDYTLQEIRAVLGMNFSFIGKPFDLQMVLQRVAEGCEKWKTNYQMNASHSALLNLAEDMEVEINHRKEIEEKLEQAIRAKDEFLSSMSHELRTPLTTMIGYNEIMSEESGMPLQYREMAESSLLAGKTLLQLVNDILDMSKIRAGKFELSESPFNFRKMVNDIRELMQVFGQQKGVGVKLKIDQQVEPLLTHRWIGDEMRISQVLFNLLSNAIKFSGSGQQVQFSVQLERSASLAVAKLYYLKLVIADQGIGMSEKTLSRLFRPFEQADSSTSKRFGGTGLGLYIAQQLVTMMGGAIRVESAEGRGSVFTATIPLKQSEVEVNEEQEHGSSVEAPQLSGCVLLAEDTLQLQRLTTVLLQKSGVSVEVASNGLEALKMGEGNRYQLILMDMQMPEMDGIEATRRLRQLGVSTPIVALTANVLPQHQEMFERAGGSGFLSKPIKRSRLYRLLERYLPPADSTPQPMATVEEPVVPSAADQNSGEEDLSDLMDEEMMQEFWTYVVEARTDLEHAWAAEAWDQLRKTAHALKGMGGSYGQPEMTAYAAEIQEHALSGDRERMEEPFQKLIACCVQP